VADECRLLESAGHAVSTLTRSAANNRGIALGARTIWSRGAIGEFRQLLKQDRPDVVHFHNLFPNLSPAVLRAAHAERVPVVMTLHNFRLACLPATFLRDGRICEDCLGRSLWRGVAYGCYRGSHAASAALAASLELHRRIRSFERVERFLVVSAFMREKLLASGLDGAKVHVRPNFAFPVARRRGSGSYFLVLGRLAPEKGLDVLFEAWDGVGTLVVAGDGPERRRLESVAPPGVEFRGTVDPDAVPALLAGARALLFPSQSYEGSPRAVVEALAAGLPVVGSAIGGIPEHVEDRRSGLLVEPRDVRGWAAAIESLRDDRVAIRLGDGAFRTWRSRFGPDAALASLEAAYAEAIELRGTPVRPGRV
jgi:glycosyltransferase involved in cell wall biosynthesis